jgi:hypothetical protein
MEPAVYKALLDKYHLTMFSTHSGASDGPDLEKQLEGFQLMGIKYTEVRGGGRGGRGGRGPDGPGGPAPGGSPPTGGPGQPPGQGGQGGPDAQARANAARSGQAAQAGPVVLAEGLSSSGRPKRWSRSRRLVPR